jgi:hypothetical protein
MFMQPNELFVRLNFPLGHWAHERLFDAVLFREMKDVQDRQSSHRSQ